MHAKIRTEDNFFNNQIAVTGTDFISTSSSTDYYLSCDLTLIILICISQTTQKHRFVSKFTYLVLPRLNMAVYKALFSTYLYLVYQLHDAKGHLLHHVTEPLGGPTAKWLIVHTLI